MRVPAAQKSGRRTWRSRGGGLATTDTSSTNASSQTANGSAQTAILQDELEIMETRPFLNSSSRSGSALMSSSSSLRSVLPGNIAAKAARGGRYLYQGLVWSQTLATGNGSSAGNGTTANSSNNFAFLGRKRRTAGSSLLHSKKKHHATSDAIHVQVPKRLMYYTAAVFLVLPIIIFVWKEFHLRPEPATARKKRLRHRHEGNGLQQDIEKQFPTWMDQYQQEQGQKDAEERKNNNNSERDPIPVVPQAQQESSLVQTQQGDEKSRKDTQDPDDEVTQKSIEEVSSVHDEVSESQDVTTTAAAEDASVELPPSEEPDAPAQSDEHPSNEREDGTADEKITDNEQEEDEEAL